MSPTDPVLRAHVHEGTWCEPCLERGIEVARAALASEADTREGLDVEVLRQAIYAVSVRHDWANTTDTEDRTDEIATEYRAILSEMDRPNKTWPKDGIDHDLPSPGYIDTGPTQGGPGSE